MAHVLTKAGDAAAQRLVSTLGLQIRYGIGPAPRYVGIRSRVARVELRGGHGEYGTAVVKERVDGEGGGYDPADHSPGSFATRVAYESAALAFLADRADRPLAPRLIGVDYDAGVLVMEDLGEGAGLFEYLQGSAAQQADWALRSYGTAMGELHACSAGRDQEFSDLLARYGPRPANRMAGVVDAQINQFERAIDAVGLAVPAEVRNHLAAAADRMRDPGPFLALTHGDICPGHDRRIDDNTLFIDLELAGFRHAFCDLAYLCVPFPSCGLTGRAPAESLEQAVAAYRKTASRGIPQVTDDDRFRDELMHAWTFRVVADVGGLLPGALDSDSEWGTATHRQRIIQLLESFAAFEYQHPVVAQWATQAHQALVRRWSSTTRMSSFPVYDSGSSLDS